MAIIYRLESATAISSDHYSHDTERAEMLKGIGLGAYRANLSDEACGGNSNSDNHPAPFIDMKLAPIWENLEDSKAYVFGFRSLEELRRWFSNDDWMLSDWAIENATIAVYTLPDDMFHAGSFQVIGHAPSMVLATKLSTDYGINWR